MTKSQEPKIYELLLTVPAGEEQLSGFGRSAQRLKLAEALGAQYPVAQSASWAHCISSPKLPESALHPQKGKPLLLSISPAKHTPAMPSQGSLGFFPTQARLVPAPLLVFGEQADVALPPLPPPWPAVPQPPDFKEDSLPPQLAELPAACHSQRSAPGALAAYAVVEGGPADRAVASRGRRSFQGRSGRQLSVRYSGLVICRNSGDLAVGCDWATPLHSRYPG